MINKKSRGESFSSSLRILHHLLNQEEKKMSGAKNLTFVILAAFPFLLMAVFEKIDHALKGGLGGF